MTRRKRVLITLLFSIFMSVVLAAAHQITHLMLFFYTQMPAMFAFVAFWGTHSLTEHPVVTLFEFCLLNALAYWPIIYGLSFLWRTKANQEPLTP